jgi:hypothetical protein
MMESTAVRAGQLTLAAAPGHGNRERPVFRSVGVGMKQRSGAKRARLFVRWAIFAEP